MTESDLIRKAREGDEGALSAIFGRYESDLRGVAFKILQDGDDVADALQTVRIKVWKKIGNFDPGKGAKLSTWLHTITERTSLDVLRKRGAVDRGDEDDAVTVRSTGRAGFEWSENDLLEISIQREGTAERKKKVEAVRGEGRKAFRVRHNAIWGHVDGAARKAPDWRGDIRADVESFPEEIRSEAVRILDHEETEKGLKWLLDAGGKVGKKTFLSVIHRCALAARGDVPTGYSFADPKAAPVVLKALREFERIFVAYPEAFRAAASMVEPFTKRRTGGRPTVSSETETAILILTDLFRKCYGRPVHAATAALLRATFPGSKWTPARVAEFLSRR